MKGKTGAIAIVTLILAGRSGVRGEEIITDLPGSSEHSGAIYGSIYDNRKEEDKSGRDIDIEILPSGGNNSRPSGGGNGPILEEYSWQKERGVLLIRRSLMERAKKEKKGLVFRILNEEGEAEYRIRIEARDIEEREPIEIEIELGKCPHREDIEGKVEGGKKVSGILLCQQEEIEIPMKIGVAVDKKWKEEGVYEYEYKEGKLRYEASGVGIDDEGMVEIEMEAGKDSIFSKDEIETGGRNIRTFVEGITEGNEEVDRKKGIAAIVLAGAGVSLGGMGVWRYLKRRGKRT